MVRQISFICLILFKQNFIFHHKYDFYFFIEYITNFTFCVPEEPDYQIFQKEVLKVSVIDALSLV